MNGILTTIREKTKNFLDVESAKFDKYEINEMFQSLQAIHNLQNEICHSEITSGANEIEREVSAITKDIETAKRLCEINDLPEHFKTAFVEILDKAIEKGENISEFTDGIRKDADKIETMVLMAYNAD